MTFASMLLVIIFITSTLSSFAYVSQNQPPVGYQGDVKVTGEPYLNVRVSNSTSAEILDHIPYGCIVFHCPDFGNSTWSVIQYHCYDAVTGQLTGGTGYVQRQYLELIS